MTEKVDKKTQQISLAVPEELVRSADFVGEGTGQDRCALLLRWLQAGAEREMLQMVSGAELSTGKFVEVMGVTYFDVHPLAQKHGLEIGPTAEESRYAWERYGKDVARALKASRRNVEQEQE